MPANILRLNQALDAMGNIGAVTLSTHKNVGNLYSDSFTIENMGGAYPMLALPVTFPPCSWGTITLEVVGCVKPGGPGLINPVPLTGAAFPIGPPNPSGFLPTVFAPWVPSSAGVIVTPMSRFVHTLPPGANPPAIAPGVVDVLSSPGAIYKLNFTVVPHAGLTGLYRWEFPLTASGAPVGTIAVVATLIEPTRLDSD